jgi:hypothetical protein
MSVIDGLNLGNVIDINFFETTNVGHGFNGANSTIYTLKGDIDLDYVENYTSIIIDNNNIFDGSGYTITIKTGSIATFNGLFNVIKGTVRNVKVVQSSSITLASGKGYIVSNDGGSGIGKTCIVENCGITFDNLGIGCGAIVGSYAGSNNGMCTINNCQSFGVVGLNDNCGGIVGSYAGDNGECRVFNCHHNGTVNSIGGGGIVGAFSAQGDGVLTIANCLQNGDLININCGGIVGKETGSPPDDSIITISNCITIGSISAHNCGGICGPNYGVGNLANTGSASFAMSHSIYVGDIPNPYYTTGGALLAGSDRSGADVSTTNVSLCFYNKSSPSVGIKGPTSDSIIASGNNPITQYSVQYLGPSSIAGNYEGEHLVLLYQSLAYPLDIVSDSYDFDENNYHPSATYQSFNSQSLLTTYPKPRAMGVYSIDPISGSLPVSETAVFWLPNANDSLGTYKVFRELDDSFLGDLSQYKSSDPSITFDSNIYTSTVNFGGGSSPMNFYIQQTPIVCTTCVIDEFNTASLIGKTFFETSIAGHGFNGAINTIFTLNGDIDIDYVENFTPIVVDDNNVFDGSNYTITIKTGSTATFAGLFNVINGKVRNLKVVHASSITLATDAGYIATSYAGYGAGNICEIINCTAIYDNMGIRCGGIVGSYAGGNNGLCIINNCHSFGVVGLNDNCGGIVGSYAGDNGECRVFNCHHNGTVNSIGGGGIVGAFSAQGDGVLTIANCLQNGDLININCGGIVGKETGSPPDDSIITISNCITIGSISAHNCGGICGPNYGVGNIGSASFSMSHSIYVGDIPNPYYTTGGALLASSDRGGVVSTTNVSLCFYNKSSPSVNIKGPTFVPISALGNNPITQYSVQYLGPSSIAGNYEGEHLVLLYQSLAYPLDIVSDSYDFDENNYHPSATYQSFNSQSMLTTYTKPYTMGVYTIDPVSGSLPVSETAVFWLPNANDGLGTYKVFRELDNTFLGDLSQYKSSDSSITFDSNIYTGTINFGGGSSSMNFYVQNYSLITQVIDDANIGNVADKTFFETTGIGHGFNGAMNTTYTLNGNIDLDYVENYTSIIIDDNNIFDGSGYTITIKTGLTATFNGLFNVIKGTVRNVKVVQSSSITLASGKGYIVSNDGGSGIGKTCTVENCSITFDNLGEESGGIIGSGAGSNDGLCIVNNCQSFGSVGPNDYGGGIAGSYAGYTGECRIFNCYHNGTISSFGGGGIIGSYRDDSTILTNLGLGQVSPSNAGSATLRVANCIHTGNIYSDDAGGIFGTFIGGNEPNIKISNCVSLASIFADNCGGIGGSNCYDQSADDEYYISHCVFIGEISDPYYYTSGALLGRSLVGNTISLVKLSNSFYYKSDPFEVFPHHDGAIDSYSNNPITQYSVQYIGPSSLSGNYEGEHLVLLYQSLAYPLDVLSDSYDFDENNYHPSSSFPSLYSQAMLTNYSKPYAMGVYTIDPVSGSLPMSETVVFWLPNANNSLGTYKVFRESDDAFLGDLTQYKTSDPSITIDSNIYTGAVNFGGGSSSMNFYIQNFSLVCVHEDTHVLTKDGFKKIKDVRSGDIVYDLNNNEVTVEYNAKINITNEFISIGKGSIGENKPMNDLLIRPGHPIWMKDKEVDCDKLINGDTIKMIETEKKHFIYTLVTEKRLFVNMEDIYVCTWRKIKWEEYSKQQNIPYIKL